MMNPILTPAIAAHLLTVLPALVVGSGVMTLRKGTIAHKLWGRVWATLMVATALFSFGVQRDGLSAIHLLSVLTIVSVAGGIVAIRRGNVVAHRKAMLGAFAGSVIAGIVAAAAPGRLVHTVLFG